MKLVVGLGNPGKEYKNTRHNVGFMVLDNFLGKVMWKKKFESELYVIEYESQQVLFAKPLTYMNLSGLAVKKIIDYYKIDLKDVIVIQDDLDLSLGTFKLKRNSSSGGHNGIKSIIKELNTDEFLRLKIGIGKNTLIPIDKYVLSSFSNNELKDLKVNFETYNDVIRNFIDKDAENCMQKFN